MIGRTSSTEATYTIETLDGVIVAKTCTSWDRSFGKCDRRTFTKRGEIYTRGRLKAWAKKYGVPMPKEILIQFPVKVWWL